MIFAVLYVSRTMGLDSNKTSKFLPTGLTPTRCPDKREIWRGGAANFTFIGAKMWEYSPQTCQNFEFWQ